jgi:hypothetical protein
MDTWKEFMALTMRVITAFCTNPLLINGKKKCICTSIDRMSSKMKIIQELFMCILLISKSYATKNLLMYLAMKFLMQRSISEKI